MKNLEIFLDYIGDDGYVYRYNYDSKKYYNTGISLKGNPGNPGRPGHDGKTPHIGTNGNWFIGNIDTGVRASGSGGGGSQVQSDWNQSNSTAIDYIKNKPTIPTTLSQLSEDTTHRTVSDTEKTMWGNKQEALVSGTNIKTVNSQSILGAGNINIQGSYTPTLQSAPTSSTTTYTKDGQTVDFEIGQFARVAKQGGGYDFYQLYDLTTSNNVDTATWMMVEQVPDNVACISNDSGVGIVPEDGIRAESVTAGVTMSVNPDVVTVIDGAVGTATITLQVPDDNLAHVWDILMTTDSTVAITFAMSNSETILYPSGFSVGASKAVEISVIGVGTKYYLRYGEFA